MSVVTLSPAALARDLSIPDLTDPANRHAVWLIADEIITALRTAWDCPVRLVRGDRVVSLEDNYTRLGYPPDAIVRDARHTRYVGPTRVLRSHTTAAVPATLRALAGDAWAGDDLLLACPGVCYRRDSVDRLHSGVPHQLDLWRVRRGAPLGEADLVEMVDRVVQAALPGARWRCLPTGHPYTTAGRQIDASVRPAQPERRCREGGYRGGTGWVEIGECGLAAPAVLAGAGLTTPLWSGLALGLGLDRLVMLRKGVPDIRLLRATDPRVAGQMRDLTGYRPVSAMPPIRRDLSVAVAGTTTADPEALGDRVREALGPDADAVEEVAVLADTRYDDVPAPARQRLGLRRGQRNVLLRMVLRGYDRPLTNEAANLLRDRVYAALHEG